MALRPRLATSLPLSQHFQRRRIRYIDNDRKKRCCQGRGSEGLAYTDSSGERPAFMHRESEKGSSRKLAALMYERCCKIDAQKRSPRAPVKGQRGREYPPTVVSRISWSLRGLRKLVGEARGPIVTKYNSLYALLAGECEGEKYDLLKGVYSYLPATRSEERKSAGARRGAGGLRVLPRRGYIALPLSP